MIVDVEVPNGVSGDWKVEDMIVSEDESKFMSIRAMFKGGRGVIDPGTYKKLTRNGRIIMSNTPDECRDMFPFKIHATGSVLINGLGLGIALKMALSKPEVTDITVIEKSEDVIKLVAETYLKDKRVIIINADAYTWEPPVGKRYNAVWHDIWDDISRANLPEMTRLHRKYGRKTDWQGSWCRTRCEQGK